MATITFNGTDNVTAEFNEGDTLLLNLALSEIATVAETAAGVRITSATGSVLLLEGTTFADLNGQDVRGGASLGDVYEVFFGDDDADDEDFEGDVLAVGAGGNDVFSVAADAEALVYGNEGDDVILGGNSVIVPGTPATDPDGIPASGDETEATPDSVLVGDVGVANARVHGGLGADTIGGFGNGSVVFGGLDSDTIVAADVPVSDDAGAEIGGVTIYGGNGQADADDGDDSIIGSSGADTIYGNAGNDTIDGVAGVDLIHAGAGNDFISAEVGSTAYGGLGDDLIEGVAGADVDEGITIFGGNGISAADDGDDDIYGTANDDALYGNGGNDAIDGNGGTDTLHGGAGDDVIVNFEAGSLVMGGKGEDIIFAATNGVDEAGVTIYGGNEAADIADNNDTIVGSGAEDTIFGNGGDDLIVLGNDSAAFGGQGNDTLVSISNEDVTGVTELTGGLGDDVFAFRQEAAATSSNYTVVTDFASGEDLLDFGQTISGTATVSTNPTTVGGIIAALAAESATGTAAVLTIESGDNAGTWVGVELEDGTEVVAQLEDFTGTLTQADFVAEGAEVAFDPADVAAAQVVAEAAFDIDSPFALPLDAA